MVTHKRMGDSRFCLNERGIAQMGREKSPRRLLAASIGVLIALSVVSVFCANGAWAQTLANGSFETDSNSDGLADNWTSYVQSGATAAFTRQTANPPAGGGTYYQQTQVTTASKYAGVRQTVSGCTSGYVYTIAGYYRTNSTSATVSVRVDPAGGTTRPSTANVSTTSTAFGAFSFNVTATGTSMTIFLDTAVTTANKAGAFDAITLTPCLGPPSSASASPSTICSGASSTLTATGGVGTCKWYTGSCGGTLVGTGTSIVVSPTSTTTYYVRRESSCGNSTCVSTTVTVSANPTAPTSASASPATICSGASTTLTATGGSGTTLRWMTGSCGGTSVGTGNNLAVSPTSTTTYFARWENSCGNSTCASTTVTVNPLPVAPTSASASPSTICSGASTTLTATGGSGTDCKWYTGSCGGTYVATGTSITVSPTSTTTYYARWESNCGNSTCVSTSVTVNPAPVAPTSASASPSTVCYGSSSTLTATGGSGTQCKWYTGSCGGTYVATGTSIAVTPTSNTTYFARWENTCGNSTCVTASVTVVALPAAPTDAVADPATINQGESTTLTAAVNAGETVDWYTGSCGGTLVGSGTSLAVSPTSTTTYYPRARNTTAGCVSTSCGSAVTVTVNQPLLSNPGFESWTGSLTADNWTAYSTTGSVGCQKGTTFAGTPSISAHSGSEFQRVKLDSSGEQGGVYQRFSSTPGVLYNVSAWLATRITSAQQAEAKLGVDPTGATTPGANTTWSSVVSGDSNWTQKTLSVVATGSYVTVFLDGRHPESTTLQCNVFFDDATAFGACTTPPSAPTNAAANPSTVCNGAYSTLSASVAEGETVDWYTGSCGGTLAGSGTILNVNPTSTTTYYPRARNLSSGCVSSTCGTAVTVTVDAGPSAPTSPAASPSTVTLGSSSTLTASVAGGCTVDWYSGSCGGMFVGSGTSLAVTPTSTTTYYAKARNLTSGCESSTCASGVVVTVNASTGTLLNPGFEEWTSVYANNWTLYHTTGTVGSLMGSSFSGTPAVSPHGGLECQRIKLDTSGEQGGVYQRFSSISGVQYTVKAWILTRITNADEVEAKIGVDTSGATTPGAYTTWSSTVVGDSEWTQKTVTVTATGSYITVFANGRHPEASTDQCNVFFDDFEVMSTCTAPSAPSSPVANPSTVCAGVASTLSATVEGGCTVDWYIGSCGDTLVGSGTSLVVAPSATTTYYPRARNTTTQCESTSCGTAVTVTVNAVPTAPSNPAASPAAIDAGQSSTLTASVAGGCTVDWYTGSCGGSLVGSGTSLVVTPAITTTYYPRARNTTSGCVSASCASAVTVTVNAAPPAELLNGDFEDWTGLQVADNWTAYSTTGTVACSKGTTFSGTPAISAHGGAQFQRVTLETTAYEEGGIYQRFNSTPGVQYTVTAWIATRITSSTEAEAKMGVDPSGATIPSGNTTWSTTVTGDSNWTQKTLVVTATGSYITVFLNGRHPASGTSQCCVFFDDASCSAPVPPTIRYVKYHESGLHDGASWSTAFDRIQDAIDAANMDDEIWVASGTYKENIVLKLGVALYGGFAGTESQRSQRNWTTNVTKIDGNSAGSAVEIAASVGGTTRIDGFTITNGRAVVGGGIYLNQNGSPEILNNTITGNSAAYDGGGIFSNFGCSPTIAGNKIVGNGALANGGGIRSTTGSAVITNNFISGNSATNGGGVCCGNTTTASYEYVINNTIFGNAASSAGGGVYLNALSYARLSNNIIAYNSSGIYKQSGSGVPVLTKNDLYSNGSYNYSGLSAGGTDITSNPTLVSSTYGQVHIQPTSPCKDTGSNSEVISGYADVDNQTRILNSTVDIGADESDGTTWSFTPVTVRVKTDGSDSNNGSTWALAKATIQAAIDSAAASGGGEVWVKAGTYNESIDLVNGVYVYGGFAGTETTLSQRNWNTNLSIIDGGGAQGGAEAISLGYRWCSLDGFKIQNGEAWNGAGVRCISAAPIIQNNTITAGLAYGNGAGVYLGNSAALVKTNQITANSALGFGGGVASYHSNAEIARNYIYHNGAGLGGGAAFASANTTAKLVNNLITDNHQDASISGAWGNAIAIDSYGYPQIICNTISDNTPGSNATIYCGVYGTLCLKSNIVAYNSSGIKLDTAGTADKIKNEVYSNSGYNYSGVSQGTDLSSDPKFNDRANDDYRIKTDSPCKNAGDTASAPSDDYLGNARSTVDIGCYEWQSAWGFMAPSAEPDQQAGVQAGPCRAIDVSGRMACAGAGNQIVLLDVTDAANPFISGKSGALPGKVYGVALSGDLAYVADGKAGLQVMDVSDPARIAPVGAFATSGGIYAVAVSGGRAYVAGDAGMQILDVTDPASPQALGSYSTGARACGVTLVGSVAYVAATDSGVHVIDVSDPANPRGIGVCDTTGEARAVAAAGTSVCVADGDAGLMTIDALDASDPRSIGELATGAKAYSVALAGTYAIVANGSGGLQVVDVSNPADPRLAGACDTAGCAYAVVVSGDYAFVADGDSGVQVVDISDPTHPRLVGGKYLSAAGTRFLGQFLALK